MNIQEAKEQIKNSVKSYLTKNEFGDYVISIEKQRPIILIGAPGLGKTAIMEQVSQELGINLVAYSMTHHTRQSAIGLPFISKKNYGGKEYSVSEYTMSEIIASVYDTVEATGIKEGILFLDEINCVSETLSPAMLQFLQYKIFGKHRIPDGWVIVTAGNPPEYNNSVREFDIVTLDRLKKITVEPDYEVWKKYAYQKNIHSSIIAYLDAEKQNFYKIETTVNGKQFVTARAWEDLSEMMKLYELHGLEIDNAFISQYLQHEKISRDFSIFYELYNKYKVKYQVNDILSGTYHSDIVSIAKSAKFDERMALLSLLVDAITSEMKNFVNTRTVLEDVLKNLRDFKLKIKTKVDLTSVLRRYIEKRQIELEKDSKANTLSAEAKYLKKSAIKKLTEYISVFNKAYTETSDAVESFEALKARFDRDVSDNSNQQNEISEKLTNIFEFIKKAFGVEQEMVVFVTELTVNYYSAKFISVCGSKEYYKYNKILMLSERQKEMKTKLENLDIDED